MSRLQKELAELATPAPAIATGDDDDFEDGKYSTTVSIVDFNQLWFRFVLVTRARIVDAFHEEEDDDLDQQNRLRAKRRVGTQNEVESDQRYRGLVVDRSQLFDEIEDDTQIGHST